MNKKIVSLNAQRRCGTLERNTEIALRALGGEPQVLLAKEFGITSQKVSWIVKRYSSQSPQTTLRDATMDKERP